MLARLAPAAALLVLLTACSSMSEVKSLEKDQYSVTYSSGTQLLSWVEIKIKTLERADEYCQSLGRKLVKPSVTSNHATGLGSKRATVTFECAPIDPPKPAAQ
ncbi:hypothetical protein AXY46_06595 [Achromobacter xylosoxidans]|jgi:hypothetical protein|uniref:Uncharacterized protein n=1 Tax=Achromobacter mucicolens TaxID=1389922 RepID=A0ABM8LFH2_9BURK|nr:hypothetical protein [Achromobacter mucicolens]KXJ67526.1 hypothetical protein AXY46_06595 [Achromobacter xylosoxidans]OXC90915.1 hypothetical protein BMR85_006810 [Achromobacter sp. KAs 3-5]MCP2516141.1 hypothetical protein [Achromobacter mucicolens]MDG9966461.1 hypothetical protein [Achromobacter mucicolens]MDH1524983.1 hypothetical protein [Achromobacter mucicolens]